MPTLKSKALKPFGIAIEGFDGSEKQVKTLRQELLREGLVLIHGLSLADDHELIDFSEALSLRPGGRREKILHWDFGPVMTMAFDPDAKNYLFSDEGVPFHWDGAFHQEPSFLVFYCVQSSGKGGETLISNTIRILESFDTAARSEMRSIRLSFRTEKKAHYGGQINVPLIQSHPTTKREVLRFAEEARTELNPVTRGIFGEACLVEDIARCVYDERFCYTHRWQEGDLLLVDNFSCVHGRMPLGENRLRSFKRVQVL